MKTPKSSFLLIIADWDENIGPQILDLYSKDISLNDPDIVTINTFMTYQNLYSSESNDEFERTFLTIPFLGYNLISRILFDVVPALDVRGGLKPFFCGIFVSDIIMEDKIFQFDTILKKIAANFIEDHSTQINNYLSDIQQIMDILHDNEEAKIVLESSYSITNAINDFKKGVELFQHKDWDTSYHFLKKSNLKLEEENQIKLVMESTYLLATLLTQTNKYAAANGYFKKLSLLAKKLNHQKYGQISQFMEGFVNYKEGNFLEAKDIFDSVNIENSQFINKLQFYSLWGKVCANLEIYENAIKYYIKSFELCMVGKETPVLQKQRGQILYELGFLYYQFAIYSLKKNGFSGENTNSDEIYSLMENSIDYFNNSISVLELLNDYDKIGRIYQFIATIYGFMSKPEDQLNHLTLASETMIKSNKYTEIIQITHEIIRILENQGENEKIVTIIKKTLHNLIGKKFIDSLTISSFHLKLAKSLFQLKRYDDSILELVGVINTYNTINIQTTEYLDALNLIINIYSDLGNTEKEDYYKDQVIKVKAKMNKPGMKEAEYSMGIIRDLWIFSDSGLELFSYAPEMHFDPALLGGFLTAIQAFSQEISKERLDSLELGNSKYFFYKENNQMFYILARANKNVLESSMNEILRIVTREFSQKYDKILNKFNGNIIPFNSFKEDIENMDFSLY